MELVVGLLKLTYDGSVVEGGQSATQNLQRQHYHHRDTRHSPSH
jgi:hypothetical protein